MRIVDKGIVWQYFTVFCDDGTKMAGAFSATDNDCDVWLSVYGKEVIGLQRYYSSDFFTCASEGNFKIDGNYFVRDKGNVRLRIKQPDLELVVNAKSVVDWKDNMIRRKAGNIDATWVVHGLRMEAEGTLSVGDRKKPFKGLMFHDSVRHNIKPSLDLLLNYDHWLWGIAYTKSYSVLFVDVDYKKNPLRFMCVNDSKVTESSNDPANQEDFEFLSSGKMPVRHFGITYGDRYMEFSELRPFKVVHGRGLSRLFAKVAEKKHHYVGKFSYRGEVGEAYLESHKLF